VPYPKNELVKFLSDAYWLLFVIKSNLASVYMSFNKKPHKIIIKTNNQPSSSINLLGDF